VSRDEGSIAPVVPAVIMVLLILGGLIVDGSRELNSRGRAQAYAEEAARAGANGVDLTRDPLALDPTQVQTLVDGYCTSVKAADASVVSCGTDTPAITAATACNTASALLVVHVVVTTRINTTLMGIVGLTAMTSTGRASARPYEGVTAATAC
jgi:Flp pilus assembly protein TadG